MANSKDSREAKVRLARMEANRQLRADQVAQRRRDNRVAVAAMIVVLAVAVALALTVF